MGELEKSTSRLSTSDAAKKSATAVLEVRCAEPCASDVTHEDSC